MKKTVIAVFILLSFLFGCQAGNHPNSASTGSTKEEQTTMEEQTMSQTKQLTPSQLISIVGLPQNQYDTDYLQRFIEYFDISESNVHSLNIELLLSSFEELDNAIDVRSIFTETPSASVSADPEQIIAVAFYQNINTGIDSVYYDFETLSCYKAKDIDLFYDLSQVSPIALSAPEAESIRSRIIELGVLDWQSFKKIEDISDPQSMGIAIRFADGSLFRVTASGLLYKDGPSHYAEVKDLLLGD